MPGKKRIKHKKVRSLRCFQLVKEMLEYGYPISIVAEKIINQGEWQGASKHTITAALCRFRDDLLPVGIITKRVPHVIIEAKKRYDDKLEDLKRLDVQYEAMLYRFDAAHAKERETQKFDGQVDLMNRGIVDLIFKMHRIKVELGLSGQTDTGNLEVSAERLQQIREQYGDKAAAAMANPVSRARVIAYLKAVQDYASYDLRLEKGDQIVDAEIIEREEVQEDEHQE